MSNAVVYDWKAELTELLKREGLKSLDGRKPVSNRTLTAREEILFMCMKELHQLGYKLHSVRNLKEKHVQVLVKHWESKGISGGTMANRLTILRALAKWIGKEGMVKGSLQYVSGKDKIQRTVSAQEDKSWSAKGIDAQKVIQHVVAYDKYVGLQLMLMYAFGLRREEAIQFRPHQDQEDFYLRIRNGTKGGRERLVIIENTLQAEVLVEARSMTRYPSGHCGWPDMTLMQSIQHFQAIMRRFGITKGALGITSHGLRHQRLNDMYEEIAGVPAPVRQLEALKQGLPLVEGEPDRVLKARSRTTSTAGHARLGITTAYSGSARSVKQAIKKMSKEEFAERVRLVPATEGPTTEDCEPESV